MFLRHESPWQDSSSQIESSKTLRRTNYNDHSIIMLSIPQQARAALVYIKDALSNDPETESLLEDKLFVDRLDMNFVTVYGIQSELYGHRQDALDSLVALVKTMAKYWTERPDYLKKLDKKRELEPDWFLSNEMLGKPPAIPDCPQGK